MFTPLDVCIEIVSASAHSIRSKFDDVTTWSSVKDPREGRSRIDLMIRHGESDAFCKVEVGGLDFDGARKRMLIDVFGEMDLTEGSGINLDGFALDEAMLRLKDLRPIVTAGSNYRLSSEKGRDLVVSRSLKVRIRIFEDDVGMRELEAFEYDKVGADVADAVAFVLSIYQGARHAPTGA